MLKIRLGIKYGVPVLINVPVGSTRAGKEERNKPTGNDATIWLPLYTGFNRAIPRQLLRYNNWFVHLL